MLVNYRAIFVFENFEEKLIVVDWVLVSLELTIGYEVFAVNTVVSLGVWTESAHIEALNASSDLATKTGLVCINWVKGDSGILDFPETAKSTFLITTGHAKQLASHSSLTSCVVCFCFGSSARCPSRIHCCLLCSSLRVCLLRIVPLFV